MFETDFPHPTGLYPIENLEDRLGDLTHAEKTKVLGGNAAVAGTAAIGVTAPDANTKMQVNGSGTSGHFTAKFYAGSDLAAWVRKK